MNRKQKKCYVIMPYGGNDEKKKKFYDSVFSSLISPPARNLSYTPIRQNINPDYHKGIVDGIFENLLSADIVIADISELNWNVAFEIGYRTALQKRHRNQIVDHFIIYLFNHSKGVTQQQFRLFEHILNRTRDCPLLFNNSTTLDEFVRHLSSPYFYSLNDVPFMINQQNIISYTDEDVALCCSGKSCHSQIQLASAIRQLEGPEEDEAIKHEKDMLGAVYKYETVANDEVGNHEKGIDMNRNVHEESIMDNKHSYEYTWAVNDSDSLMDTSLNNTQQHMQQTVHIDFSTDFEILISDMERKSITPKSSLILRPIALSRSTSTNVAHGEQPEEMLPHSESPAESKAPCG